MSGYHLYSTDGKTVASLTAALGLSKAYVALVTHSYVTDIVKGDLELKKQVRIAREMDLSAILIYFDDLTVQDREDAKTIFQGLRIVKTLEAPHEPHAFTTWLVKNMDTFHIAVKEAVGK